MKSATSCHVCGDHIDDFNHTFRLPCKACQSREWAARKCHLCGELVGRSQFSLDQLCHDCGVAEAAKHEPKYHHSIDVPGFGCENTIKFCPLCGEHLPCRDDCVRAR